MGEKIHFEIPTNVAENDFSRYLVEHQDEYRLALDLTGDYFDRKSQVDGVQVMQADLQASCVTIHYRVTYSGFRPCQDLRYTEVSDRRITGQRVGREFRFEKFQTVERRSTCDEL